MEIEEEKTEQKHLIPFEIKQQIVFYKTQGTLNNKEIAEEIFKYFWTQNWKFNCSKSLGRL